MQDTKTLTVRSAFEEYCRFFSNEDLKGLDLFLESLDTELRHAVLRMATSYRWLRKNLVERLARKAA